MNAVGIDVSKGKSMMAVRRPMGEVVLMPKEYPHTEVGLERLALDMRALFGHWTSPPENRLRLPPPAPLSTPTASWGARHFRGCWG